MLVRSIMSSPVKHIPPETQVGKALEFMKINEIKHLPIVKEKTNQLVGVVSEGDLLKVFPKKNLNQFEQNLLSRTVVSKVMSVNPIVVHPDETLENAAMIIQRCKVPCLPVVANGNLEGMLCESDLIKAFMSAMGIGQAGTRVTLKFQPRNGFLSQLIAALDELNAIVVNMVYFAEELVLKVSFEDQDLLRQRLEAKGYQVLHIAKDNTSACPLPVK